MRRPGYEATSPVLATDEDYKNKNVIKSCRYSKNVIKRLYKHFFFDFFKFFHAFWMYIYCGFECTCSCIILQKEKKLQIQQKYLWSPTQGWSIYLWCSPLEVWLWIGRRQTLNFRTFHQSPRFLFPSPSSTSPWPQELSNSHRVHLLVSLRGRTSSSVCALYPVTPGVRTPHCSQ